MDSIIKIGKAAKILGVSTRTLRRWEAKGLIPFAKTLGGTRVYSEEALKKLLETPVEKPSNLVSIIEASEKLGISIRTLRRWNQDGRLKPKKSSNGQIFYRIQEIERILQNISK